MTEQNALSDSRESVLDSFMSDNEMPQKLKWLKKKTPQVIQVSLCSMLVSQHDHEFCVSNDVRIPHTLNWLKTPPVIQVSLYCILVFVCSSSWICYDLETNQFCLKTFLLQYFFSLASISNRIFQRNQRVGISSLSLLLSQEELRAIYRVILAPEYL